jgi:RHS repeat-associated protein
VLGFTHNLTGNRLSQNRRLRDRNVMRNYDQSSRRYLQPEPIGLVGGSNPYVYVRNAPVIFYDSFGKDSFAVDWLNQGGASNPGQEFDGFTQALAADYLYSYLGVMENAADQVSMVSLNWTSSLDFFAANSTPPAPALDLRQAPIRADRRA